MYLLLPLDQFTRYFQLHKAKYTNAAFVTFLKLLYFLCKRDGLLEKKKKARVPCGGPHANPSRRGKERKLMRVHVGWGSGEAKGQEREASHFKAELFRFPDLGEQMGT